MIQFRILPRTLHFRQPAGTSRGVYTLRQIWYLIATDSETGQIGIGECAPLHDLSCDAMPNYGETLTHLCNTAVDGTTIDYEAFAPYPSMLFGVETALRHLVRGSFCLFDGPFAKGEKAIQINGLIWMGTFEEMISRLEEKIKLGFRCIKIKIGAIDFEKEISLIARLRDRFGSDKVELRLDANGGFTAEEALSKLERLSAYAIHSVEQPIRAGQWAEMARLCGASPIPIALDEELIGINSTAAKEELIKTIKPQYIILKPSLHGAMHGCDEWIDIAQKNNVGWWATSALESNVGLNAIAQWAASKEPLMPQGLGTGQLFDTNAPIPLVIEGDAIRMKAEDMPTTEGVCQWIDGLEKM